MIKAESSKTLGFFVAQKVEESCNLDQLLGNFVGLTSQQVNKKCTDLSNLMFGLQAAVGYTCRNPIALMKRLFVASEVDWT